MSVKRSWNKELEHAMNQLETRLEEECDAYITNIKQPILKYFHHQYYRATEARLKAFDEECMPTIVHCRKQLKEVCIDVFACLLHNYTYAMFSFYVYSKC